MLKIASVVALELKFSYNPFLCIWSISKANGSKVCSSCFFAVVHLILCILRGSNSSIPDIMSLGSNKGTTLTRFTTFFVSSSIFPYLKRPSMCLICDILLCEVNNSLYMFLLLFPEFLYKHTRDRLQAKIHKKNI